MKVRWPVVFAVLALGAGTAAPATAAVKPVVTNKNRFRIPFRFDPVALKRMNARELQLHSSSNRGGSWELTQTISPETGKFEFHAPADGEYWFAVRTIDQFGAAHPPGARLEAGLIVVVDSIAPSLAINLEQTGDGRIRLTWSASDANLDPTTLRMEFLQPGNSDWQAVGIVPTQRGTTTWSLPSSGKVAVRGAISDFAGNMGESSADLIARAPARPRDPQKPDLRQPIATEPGIDQFSEQKPNPATAPQMTIQPGFAASTPSNSNPVRESTPQDLATPTPGVVGRSVAVPLVSSPHSNLPSVVQDRWSSVPGGEPAAGRNHARQRLVNTKKFQLGYKIDDVGPSGVGGVELFITPNQGEQWYRYGEDLDRQSPFDVEVPRDGVYGFMIRVRSGVGLALDPPLPGESPAIEVIVDQTPPRVELLPVRQGTGTEVNQVTVQWRMSEDRPADKPISLYSAPTLQGPWELISGWRPDSGSFTWTVAAGSPSQFFVRVMARDAAGNVTQIDMEQPIVVDLTRPSARIVDVEAAPQPR